MNDTITIHSLSRTFGANKALDGVNLSIEKGEIVALIGASGSGKSTLLRHIAGLARGDASVPNSRVCVGGRTVQKGGQLARDVRDIRAGIGFVFQQFNLVDRLPVITNVLAGMLHRIPAWRSTIKHFTRDEIRMGIDALARVGMAERALQRASTLSGGQQQRAAIARTLVQRAGVILADEPIASLDPESSRKVMEILSKINREDGTTVVVSLHQVDVAFKYCPRTVALHRGKVVYDGASSALTPALLRELYGAEADEILLPPVPTERKDDSAPLFLHRAYVESPLKSQRQEMEATVRAAV
jgi:phosphonate transport system ATP-binding protein